jgi:hypothetical protein
MQSSSSQGDAVEDSGDDDAVDDDLKQELSHIKNIKDGDIDAAINDYQKSCDSEEDQPTHQLLKDTMSAMLLHQEKCIKIVDDVLSRVQITDDPEEDRVANNVVQQTFFNLLLRAPGKEADFEVYYKPKNQADRRRRKIIYKRCLRKWHSDLKKKCMTEPPTVPVSLIDTIITYYYHLIHYSLILIIAVVS